jgi:hypothetical protein
MLMLGGNIFMGPDANGFALDCKEEIQVLTAAVVSPYPDAPIIPMCPLLSPLESSGIACLKDNRSRHALTFLEKRG